MTVCKSLVFSVSMSTKKDLVIVSTAKGYQHQRNTWDSVCPLIGARQKAMLIITKNSSSCVRMRILVPLACLGTGAELDLHLLMAYAQKFLVCRISGNVAVNAFCFLPCGKLQKMKFLKQMTSYPAYTQGIL